jgi:hypothetical protein
VIARSLSKSAVKTEIELGRFASFSLVRVPDNADDAAYPRSLDVLTSKGESTMVSVADAAPLGPAGAGLGTLCARPTLEPGVASRSARAGRRWNIFKGRG